MEDQLPTLTTEENKKPGFDRSDIIAFVALTISIIGTVISIQETSIMNRQHELMTEQKAASAWPYLDDEINIEYTDSIVTITLDIVNKGTGPAIVGETTFFYADEELEVYDVGQVLTQYFPGADIRQNQSYKFANSVFAPNDRQRIITLIARQSDELHAALPMIQQNFNLEFCYCSIYGACWSFPREGWPQPTKDCEIDVFITD